ncbi:MAG: inorganic diphosphatase, partial [Capsulimonas sp.]|nr:inorganic diphosphatase [Capsulimonas sp.]
GDPLDILVLMDAPVFTRCLVEGRLIGVIEAEQTERDGKTMRNDRLVAVAIQSYTHGRLKALKDLDENFVDQIEHFFVSYNQMAGKEFKPTGRFGPDRAQQLVDAGVKKFDQSQS